MTWRNQRILTVDMANVMCQATVDLLSRVQRPFLWRVTVRGLPPHTRTRIYDINARTDNEAAIEGMKRFKKAMERPFHFIEIDD